MEWRSQSEGELKELESRKLPVLDRNSTKVFSKIDRAKSEEELDNARSYFERECGVRVVKAPPLIRQRNIRTDNLPDATFAPGELQILKL
mmetsp:Transcript_2726/g.4944  ORF Transcript_2726/g.4944 Transcript_2726/m.4944 type:complete len:90 (+) Transcript_2726:130-399(+)